MEKHTLSIVTGASRGIGKAIAIRLAKEGHTLMLFGRDHAALEDVRKIVSSLGIESQMFIGDLTDKNFIDNSVNNIIDDYGKIDNLINNAGIGILNKFVESSIDEFKKQMDVNLFAVYNFTKAVVNNMIEHRGGTIINISSLAGKNSFVGGTMYSATKHALMGFTRSLMLELREYNIRVIAICPGSVNTDFNPKREKVPNSGKILLAEDVAETVAMAIKLPISAMASEIDLRPTNPK
ncbi:MAG: SDR family oxidoreductase [Ignavibacteriaceae bacterium]|nr:SDR family oxidoreductase [Ignavibacteriaceae bacterium]